MSDLGDAIRKAAEERLQLIMKHREKYLEAWIAEHGCHPSECHIEEIHHPDGRLTLAVVRGQLPTTSERERGREDERGRILQLIKDKHASLGGMGQHVRWGLIDRAIGGALSNLVIAIERGE